MKVITVNANGQQISIPQGKISVRQNTVAASTIIASIVPPANGWSSGYLSAVTYGIEVIDASNYNISIANCVDCATLSASMRFTSGTGMASGTGAGHTTVFFVKYVKKPIPTPIPVSKLCSVCSVKQSNGKYLIGGACGVDGKTLCQCSGIGTVKSSQVCSKNCHVNANTYDTCQ